jgi:signal transduction histidine kinase
VETFEALLRITQIEAGARRAHFSDVDLAAILADVADIYEPVAEEEGDRLEAAVDAEGPVVMHGDRELLTQLFANLIENAIRHCPRGTRIRVELVRRGDGHVAVVADDGPGIPHDECANVFRRLYRLERARSTPGSGLGLSLVMAIAELHGAGVVLVDNAPGLRVEVAFLKKKGAMHEGTAPVGEDAMIQKTQ